MTTLEQIQKLLPRLNPNERARLATLSCPPIEKIAGVNGGSASIRQTRIVVWMLEAARRERLSEGEILAMCSELEADDLEEAWRCVAANEEEVEREIWGNK